MTKPITGGDLYFLWKVGHQHLPKVGKIYENAVSVHKGKLSEGDEATFGTVYPAWLALLSATGFLMQRTVFSLETTTTALDKTIDQYRYVDGENAKGLTDAGKAFEEYVDKKKNPPKD